MPGHTSSVRPTPSWTGRLVRSLLLWILPVVVVWLLITPFYNRFLSVAGERLARLTEFPGVTRLYIQETHQVLVTRSDMSGKQDFVYKFRLTDLHFNLILTVALFLAVPAVENRRRMENLGWALLASVCFHILVLFFYVKFVYSTQLGAWSSEHYGPLAQNLWGFGKHLLDLPFKLALPFILWTGFYFQDFQRNLRRS
jgi:hypothetical protein